MMISCRFEHFRMFGISLLVMFHCLCVTCINSEVTSHFFHKQSSCQDYYRGYDTYKLVDRFRGGNEGLDGNNNIVDSCQAVPPRRRVQFYIFKGGLCPFAGRTWIVLEELGIPYETIFVDYHNKPESFLKVNPRGQVPAVVVYHDKDADGIDDQMKNPTVVYESSICNEYLCDYKIEKSSKVSQTPMSEIYDISLGDILTLFPTTSSTSRAKIRMFNDQFDKDVFPIVRKYIMNEDSTLENELWQECIVALWTLQHNIKGPYMMGEHFTLADVHAIPFVMRWMIHLRHFKNKDLRQIPQFEILCRWYDTCQCRESVQKVTIPETTLIQAFQEKMNTMKQQQQQDR